MDTSLASKSPKWITGDNNLADAQGESTIPSWDDE